MTTVNVNVHHLTRVEGHGNIVVEFNGRTAIRTGRGRFDHRFAQRIAIKHHVHKRTPAGSKQKEGDGVKVYEQQCFHSAYLGIRLEMRPIMLPNTPPQTTSQPR